MNYVAVGVQVMIVLQGVVLVLSIVILVASSLIERVLQPVDEFPRKRISGRRG